MTRHRGTVLGVVLFVAAVAAMWAAPSTHAGVEAVALAIPVSADRSLAAAGTAAPFAIVLMLIFRRLP